MILEKAKEALERKVQFPSHKEAFELYSKICDVCFGLSITPVQIAQVMKAIKIGREKFVHNEDNLVDLCGYTEIENELKNHEHQKSILVDMSQDYKIDHVTSDTCVCDGKCSGCKGEVEEG